MTGDAAIGKFSARPQRSCRVAATPVAAAVAAWPRQRGANGCVFTARARPKNLAWFKDSFLEFEEDVAEAAAANRRVMLYFHQDGCPYCARLVEENFHRPRTESLHIEHFDGISLNMWGDREVVSVGGRDFTEKTFAAALKVQYTPTLIFLDESGKVALRLNGYYPPDDFRAALPTSRKKWKHK